MKGETMQRILMLFASMALLWTNGLLAGEAGPFVINAGVFTTPSVVMSAAVHHTIMQWCPTGFDTPDQLLSYTFEQCTIQETSCAPLVGGEVLGGPLFNRQGNPITCAPVYTIPRIRGQPSRVRMTGVLTSATPIEISFVFEPH
jgi:hypothetical protein